MPYVINDACTACGLCLEQCPISAISAGDPIFTIDETCCDFEECLVVCPEEAIVPVAEDDPNGSPADTLE